MDYWNGTCEYDCEKEKSVQLFLLKHTMYCLWGLLHGIKEPMYTLRCNGMQESRGGCLLCSL